MTPVDTGTYDVRSGRSGRPRFCLEDRIIFGSDKDRLVNGRCCRCCYLLLLLGFSLSPLSRRRDDRRRSRLVGRQSGGSSSDLCPCPSLGWKNNIIGSGVIEAVLHDCGEGRGRRCCRWRRRLWAVVDDDDTLEFACRVVEVLFLSIGHNLGRDLSLSLPRRCCQWGHGWQDRCSQRRRGRPRERLPVLCPSHHWHHGKGLGGEIGRF